MKPNQSSRKCKATRAPDKAHYAMTARLLGAPSLGGFLYPCNGKCRARLFNEVNYKSFINAIAEAHFHAIHGAPYYKEQNAGGVAKSYGYNTTTARWGVWVCPETMKVKFKYDRYSVGGRHVKCVYYGGERAYMRDWKKHNGGYDET